ncbi:MAG: cell division protein FtsQ/DivIB [Omnitrophica bacterium]|nr:cell division protein FtsQ/DivIB [Candidatus Omnitrophota bacterium]
MPDYRKLIRKRTPLRRGISFGFKQKIVSRRIILLLMAGGLILAAFFTARYFLMNFSGFKISKVSVINREGQTLENPENIFRLDGDFNLFIFDIQKLVQDIKAKQPQIQDVLVRKQFPNKLLIVVQERKPVAVIISGSSYLVDAEAFVLPFETRYKDLPKVIGVHPRQFKVYSQTHSLRLKRALNLVAELKKAKIYPAYRVLEVDVRQYSDVAFYLEDGIEIKMGNGDFARKVLLLKEILAQLKAKGSMPKYIDMRFGDPVVKY